MKYLSDASFMLRIQIHRDHSQVILRLSQKTYISKGFLKDLACKIIILVTTLLPRETTSILINVLRMILKLRNVKEFVCFNCKEFHVCLSLKAFKYYILSHPESGNMTGLECII